MNFIVDIGNTYIKASLFDKGKILWQEKSKADSFLELIIPVFSKYKDIKNLIYSASGFISQDILDFFHSQCHVIAFSHNSKLPFNNTYETPNTLGLDRLALVAAAHHLYPQQNVLIIDAGTCITYDIITKQANYLGGSISPGIDMRFKALHKFTAGLPLISFEKPKTHPVGKNTKDAILNGVLQGVVYEIDQNIERYMSDFKDLTIILTGGNQQYLSTQLKNSIFANSNFQQFGLHAILEHLLND
jgi:type III pantothenate kinase